MKFAINIINPSSLLSFLLATLVICCCCSHAGGVVILTGSGNGDDVDEAHLHNYMTEPELAYYFQTTDRNSVPTSDYEIVYLPATLPVREAIKIGSNEQSDDEASNSIIDYNFSAFQR